MSGDWLDKVGLVVLIAVFAWSVERGVRHLGHPKAASHFGTAAFAFALLILAVTS